VSYPQIHITDTSFDPEAAHREFRDALEDTGAIIAFTGVVRGEGEIKSLMLSHYPGFTEAEIARIGEEASKRWGLTGWQIIHRIGKMAPREPIVFVATASAHRRAAFEAADFLMDYLKSEAPFWKQEQRGGETHWIEPRKADYADKKRWSP
jgi:molybdopterin synthase catalytic subunit